MHDVDDVLDVLVCLRHLLGEGVAPGRAREHAALAQLIGDVPTSRRLHGGRSAEPAPGAVARAPERLPHRVLGADQ